MSESSPSEALAHNEVSELLRMFKGPKVDLKDLSAQDSRAVLGKKCEVLFTNGVDVLRSRVPNERVRGLARVVWDLVGNKQVLVGLGADVPTLTFMVLLQGGIHQGVVLIPWEWPKMVEEDPFMQLGAILFVGAQIVDFYNDRLFEGRRGYRRHQAYEAEMLHTFKGWLPGWTPNAYQCQILKNFPDGLDTKDVELYVYKAYVPSKGDA